MPVEDLSANPSVVHREGRFFRHVSSGSRPADRTVRGARGLELQELRPVNGTLELAADGFLYFAGDPFPPAGRGVYRVGEAAPEGSVRLFPGLVLDAQPEGRRLRIGYRYLATYRVSAQA